MKVLAWVFILLLGAINLALHNTVTGALLLFEAGFFSYRTVDAWLDRVAWVIENW